MVFKNFKKHHAAVCGMVLFEVVRFCVLAPWYVTGAVLEGSVKARRLGLAFTEPSKTVRSGWGQRTIDNVEGCQKHYCLSVYERGARERVNSNVGKFRNMLLRLEYSEGIILV